MLFFAMMPPYAASLFTLRFMPLLLSAFFIIIYAADIIAADAATPPYCHRFHMLLPRCFSPHAADYDFAATTISFR